MLRTGLNPYGLTFHLGLQGAGTPRANPHPAGVDGFLSVAQRLGAHTLELHSPWFDGYDDASLQRLRERIDALAMTPVLSLGPPLEGVDRAIRAAAALGARIVRLGLSPVLCGDRAAHGTRWREMIDHARTTLRNFAALAADAGLTLAIENHQDFGSEELLSFAAEAGPNVGICIDTGNPLAVAEDPIAFAERVAPAVRHVHLKDYRPQWTDAGYRLVRCAIGDGAIPIPEMMAILTRRHPDLTASLEPGALEARHIRLLTPGWWEGYAPRAAGELRACLAAARFARLPEDADWRTPWERGESPTAIVQYELDMIERSAANMRALGLFPQGASK